MYIVQFQDPAREPDKIFGSRVEQTFDHLHAEAGSAAGRQRRRRASTSHDDKPSTLILAFPQIRRRL